MRARNISTRLCTTRVGSRRSGNTRANFSAKPRRRSAIARSITPPFEVSRPPSKAACAKTAEERPNLYYEITNPNTGEKIWPNKSRVWGFEPATHLIHAEEGRIYWGKDGKNSTPRLKKYLLELRRSGTVPQTVWTYQEVGHTQDAKREAAGIIPADPFPTPKPEKLIGRIVE